MMSTLNINRLFSLQFSVFSLQFAVFRIPLSVSIGHGQIKIDNEIKYDSAGS